MTERTAAEPVSLTLQVRGPSWEPVRLPSVTRGRGPGSELMSAAVYDETREVKSACGLATSLEECFVKAGWPEGQIYGAKEEICDYFGVSSRIYIEGVRILAARGTAQIRRGTPSGLMVMAPEPEMTADALCGYAFLSGVTNENKRDAIEFLARVRQRLALLGVDSSGLALFDQFLAALNPGEPPKGVVTRKWKKSRGGSIAVSLLNEYFASGFEPGRRLASEAQLSEKYCADRSLTRQAIRLLESGGLVWSKPGRGNGLITRRPPSGPVCRLVCCYLAAQKLPVPTAFELFRAMSIEAGGFAAASAAAKDVQALQDGLMAHYRPGEGLPMSDMFSIEDALFQSLGNPLIDLFIRSFRGFTALTIAEEGDRLSSREAASYVVRTRDVLSAVERREPTAAIRAYERKFETLRDLEQRCHPRRFASLFAA